MKMILIAICCFTSVSVFSQSITNTLGTGGIFSVKDASSNFLTLSQSTGQVNILKTLRLENTTNSGVGIIFKGGDRFLHNFGTNNVFLGVNSGNLTMSGASNTIVGTAAFSLNTTGFFNTSVGTSTLSSNTTGFNNTAVGTTSLTSNTTGQNNTAVGFQSLYVNTTGSHNTAIGLYTLNSNTTGSSNTALGIESLSSNLTGHNNSAIGDKSLNSNTTGHHNTSLGVFSLFSNTTGIQNTAVGVNSMYFNATGNNNTALGNSSGSNVTIGSNLTLVGYDAEPTSGSAINQITLGNNSVTSLRCNAMTITSLSDARDKKNIKDLSLGLDFIMKVKPRLFNWDKREWYENNISDGSKTEEIPTAGFIAQELDEVQRDENAEWLDLVLKDNPEKIEASYGNLLPVMVKAIQELKIESEKLKVESEKLKLENIKLKSNNEILSSEMESMRSISERVVLLEKLAKGKNAGELTTPAVKTKK